MRGIPKKFGTKQDAYNCLEIDAKATKETVQKLLDQRFSWVNGKVLDDAVDMPIVDETHKVVTSQDEEGNTTRVQYERIENPTAELFRLGFTVEEAEEFVK